MHAYRDLIVMLGLNFSLKPFLLHHIEQRVNPKSADQHLSLAAHEGKERRVLGAMETCIELHNLDQSVVLHARCHCFQCKFQSHHCRLVIRANRIRLIAFVLIIPIALQ